MAELIGYIQTHVHENKDILDLVESPFTTANETYLETTIPDKLLKSYAQIYIASAGGVTQTIPQGVTWSLITLFDTNSEYNLCTPDHVNDRIIIGKAGVYKITWTFSTYANVNNFTLNTGLFKNDILIPQARILRKFGTSTDISTGAMSIIVRCALNDVLTLKTFHNVGGNVTLTVVNANFQVDKISD